MSERIINTWRDPYDEGFSTCRLKQVTIKSGLTVLVGCNGAGKTTLLQNIKSELKKETFHVIYLIIFMTVGHIPEIVLLMMRTGRLWLQAYVHQKVKILI